jgi:long-chain acyl-CoA synthetase
MIEQVMLTGQDGRRLVAILVVNPKEVFEEGFLKTKEGTKLLAEYEKVNDPQCTEEDCEAACKVLNKVSKKLRGDKDLEKGLINAVKKATSGFQKYEQVGDDYITLDPFAMANGQLTQSYKVKRASVMETYGHEL